MNKRKNVTTRRQNKIQTNTLRVPQQNKCCALCQPSTAHLFSMEPMWPVFSRQSTSAARKRINIWRPTRTGVTYTTFVSIIVTTYSYVRLVLFSTRKSRDALTGSQRACVEKRNTISHILESYRMAPIHSSRKINLEIRVLDNRTSKCAPLVFQYVP